jgi:hypothetical protein
MQDEVDQLTATNQELRDQLAVLTEHLATVESELAHLRDGRQQQVDLQASELERLRAENLALVAQLDQPTAAAEVNVSMAAPAPPSGLAALFDSPR